MGRLVALGMASRGGRHSERFNVMALGTGHAPEITRVCFFC